MVKLQSQSRSLQQRITKGKMALVGAESTSFVTRLTPWNSGHGVSRVAQTFKPFKFGCPDGIIPA